MVDWQGNEAADALARGLARRIRQETPELDPPQEDGGVREALRQLAIGAAWVLRRWPDIGQQRGRRPRKPPGAAGEAGPHLLVPRPGGGRECARCRLFTRTPASLRSLRNKPCQGLLAPLCHSSHRLHWTRGVTWCDLCGGYSIRRPRNLRARCPGRPPSEAARNVLRRLREGLAPTTAGYLTEDTVIHHDISSAGTSGVHLAEVSPGGGPTTGADQAERRGRYVRLDQRRAWEADAAEAHPEGSVVAQPGGRSYSADHCPTPPRSEPGAESEGSSHLLVAPPPARDEAVSRRRLCGKQSPSLVSFLRRPISPPRHHHPHLAHGAPAPTMELAEPPPARRRHHHHPSHDAAAGGRRHAGGDASTPFRRPHPPRHHVGVDAAAHFCRPAAETSWSARIAVERTALSLPCACCLTATRSSCRGCEGRLCVKCARARRWCPSASTPRDAGAAAAVAVAAFSTVFSACEEPAVAAAAATCAGDENTESSATGGMAR